MSAEGDIIVEIPQGKLRGKRKKSVLGTDFYCFHRIPYAKPPLGDLRFKAPQPAEGWTGIRDATTEGTVCPSSDMQRSIYLKESNEDSLFINVYSRYNPSTVGNKKYPVLTFIHGGGFELGSGNTIFCGADYFMAHDILLITFNYRIGALGFLSLLTPECPGNFGLKDQQMALKWVKNNISYFGGDPENITIFGISAGGASVQYHTINTANKGLFKRAIAQSGSFLNRWGYALHPRENAFLLGKRLGCDTTDDKVLLDFLRKASAEDIVMKSQKIASEIDGEALGEHFLNFTFVPTAEPEHEGAYFTKHPWVILEEGKCLDIPYITGICAKEMILGLKSKDDYPKWTQDEDFQNLKPQDIKWQKNSDKALALGKRIRDFYYKNGSNLFTYVDVLSDTFFNYGIYKTAKSRITNKDIKSPTYLYCFSYEGDQFLFKTLLGLTDIKGTSHGEDMSYLFKTAFANLNKITPGSRDYKMIMNFTKLWVNFATHGVPSLEDPKVTWEPTNENGMPYLDLNENFVMKKGFLTERMQFWDEIYTSYYNE